jgi:hypothetical protein
MNSARTERRLSPELVEGSKPSRSAEKHDSMAIPNETIETKIYYVRGKKVMLDRDLSGLYAVDAGQLKRAVRRNIYRFPPDFMFQLLKEEQDSLRCHFGALNRGAHSKYLMYAFTEQGVAMLSSVLKSRRAVMVNIQIMRTFTKLREMLAHHKDLIRKIEKMENKYDHQFRIVFDAIKELIEQNQPPRLPQQPKKKFGFDTGTGA